MTSKTVASATVFYGKTRVSQLKSDPRLQVKMEDTNAVEGEKDDADEQSTSGSDIDDDDNHDVNDNHDNDGDDADDDDDDDDDEDDDEEDEDDDDESDSDSDDDDDDDDDDDESEEECWNIPIDDVMKELNLPSAYRSSFSKEGIDDLETVITYTVEELEKIGLKTGHARKLSSFALQSSPKKENHTVGKRLSFKVAATVVSAFSVPAKKTDVFLSHNWGSDSLGRNNHDRVVMINGLLKKAGFSTWCDEEQMTGDIVRRMIEGIDNSKVVLTFITARFLEKVGSPDHVPDNCKKEFMYACRKHTSARVLPVVMEPHLRDTRVWSGPVAFELGGVLYTDLCDDDNDGITEESYGFRNLCSEIKTRIEMFHQFATPPHTTLPPPTTTPPTTTPPPPPTTPPTATPPPTTTTATPQTTTATPPPQTPTITPPTTTTPTTPPLPQTTTPPPPQTLTPPPTTTPPPPTTPPPTTPTTTTTAPPPPTTPPTPIIDSVP